MSRIKKFLRAVLAMCILVLPFVVSAQGPTPGPPVGPTPGPPGPTQPSSPGLTNPLKAQTLSEFLVDVLEIVRDIGFIVAVFFIVYAGFLFVTARGNDEKLKTAKSAFLWAIVGTAVLLGAFLFATIIENTVNQI